MNDDEEDSKAEQMRFALSAIANEVQSFQNDTSSSNGSSNPEDIFSALVKCKRALRLKNYEIKVLRRNLKTACSVAKTILTTKDSEVMSLKTQLCHVKNLYDNVENQLKEQTQVINILQQDNQTFRVESQCFNNIIQLGYQQLQPIQSEVFNEVHNLKQLQKIIFYCGRYYAEALNQSEKCSQLEQKNRFLTSKLNILKSYLDSTSNEQRNYRYQKKSGDSRLKTWSKNGGSCSEYQIMAQHSSITNLKMTKIPLNKPVLFRSISNLNMTCHLTTVRKLLHDQEALLRELNCLKDEFSLESL